MDLSMLKGGTGHFGVFSCRACSIFLAAKGKYSKNFPKSSGIRLQIKPKPAVWSGCYLLLLMTRMEVLGRPMTTTELTSEQSFGSTSKRIGTLGILILSS